MPEPVGELRIIKESGIGANKNSCFLTAPFVHQAAGTVVRNSKPCTVGPGHAAIGGLRPLKHNVRPVPGYISNETLVQFPAFLFQHTCCYFNAMRPQFSNA